MRGLGVSSGPKGSRPSVPKAPRKNCPRTGQEGTVGLVRTCRDSPSTLRKSGKAKLPPHAPSRAKINTARSWDPGLGPAITLTLTPDPLNLRWGGCR